MRTYGTQCAALVGGQFCRAEMKKIASIWRRHLTPRTGDVETVGVAGCSICIRDAAIAPAAATAG